MTIPPAIAMHLGKIRGDSKGGWHCCCPVHGDTNPSATIRWGDNGELLMACMVCKGSMSRREYLRRLCDVTGTTPIDWMSETKRGTRIGRKRPMAQRIVRTFDYIDQHGELRLQVCRFASGQPKSMPRRPARPTDDSSKISVDPDGSQWCWTGPTAGDEPFDVLYRLPDLLTADPARMVFVTEGEPDADSLAELGFVAVTNWGGAMGWESCYARWLRGRNVCIVEDNDAAGIKRTQEIIGTLVLADVASIRVMRFTDMPEKGDVTDWLSLPAMELLDAAGKREEVRMRVARATAWMPARRSA